MRRALRPRIIFLAVLAILFFSFGMLHNAHAQGAGGNSFNGPACTQAMQYGLGLNSQNRNAAYMGVSTQAPFIDIKNMYCLNTIMKLFTLIAMLADPLDLLIGIVNMLAQELITLVCAAVNQVVTQITSYISSLGNALCVPMPSLPSLTGGLNLGLKNLTCNGVSLLSLQAVGGMSLVPPTGVSYWGQTVPVGGGNGN